MKIRSFLLELIKNGKVTVIYGLIPIYIVSYLLGSIFIVNNKSIINLMHLTGSWISLIFVILLCTTRFVIGIKKIIESTQKS